MSKGSSSGRTAGEENTFVSRAMVAFRSSFIAGRVILCSFCFISIAYGSIKFAG